MDLLLCFLVVCVSVDGLDLVVEYCANNYLGMIKNFFLEIKNRSISSFYLSLVTV